MSEGKEKGKKRKKSSEDIPDKAIKSNAAIAALAMKGATPFQRIVVYCCYGVILLGGIILSVPPYEALKELLAFAFTIVFLGIVAVFVLVRYRDLSRVPPITPTTTTATPQWQPLPTFKFEKLRTMLEETRKVAFEFLKSKSPELSDDDVRANIFYPEYDSSGKPDKYTLKIYPGLHCKMDYGPELQITFKPEQGATGRVFASEKACVAQRLSSDSGDWDDTFNVTDDLAKIIHPDLKWVISMPLKGTGNKPIGVMNVDGLKHHFPIDALYECMVKLTSNVIIMGHVVVSS
ncbi:hypothetical protein ES703_56475 [subsurface metagenome]